MSQFYIKDDDGNWNNLATSDEVDSKESKSKITFFDFDGTIIPEGFEYEVCISTTDAGRSGYITFVVEP